MLRWVLSIGKWIQDKMATRTGEKSNYCIFVIAYNYIFRVGAIFFLIMNQVFGNLSAIDLFVKQKALFMLEWAYTLQCHCMINDYTIKVEIFKWKFFSLFLEDRGVNHIKYLISVYKLLQISKIVKFPLLENFHFYSTVLLLLDMRMLVAITEYLLISLLKLPLICSVHDSSLSVSSLL